MIKLKGILSEKLARGLKPLLQIGTTITKKTGEEALLKLSDKFDRIDDEYAGDIASHLDMAIELMQDGYPGDATKMLKQFNKKCKDVLKGKPIASVFEGKLTEDSAKDKFNAPPMNKWWTGDKETLMSAIYHAQRQLPPTNKSEYEKNWKNIVNQLQKKFPAPSAIYKAKLNEGKLTEGFVTKYNNKSDMSILSKYIQSFMDWCWKTQEDALDVAGMYLDQDEPKLAKNWRAFAQSLVIIYKELKNLDAGYAARTKAVLPTPLQKKLENAKFHQGPTTEDNYKQVLKQAIVFMKELKKLK